MTNPPKVILFERFRKEIVYLLFFTLIIIVTFMGFALGAAKVCSDSGGHLDDRFYCHLNLTQPKQPIYDYYGVLIPTEGLYYGP